MGVAHSVVLNEQLQIFHRCELGRLENRRLDLGIGEEILGRWMSGERRGWKPKVERR